LDSLRFGIIGCSRIAKRSVIPAILKSEFAELQMIGSRSVDRAKEFSNEFNCNNYGTYEDVISDESNSLNSQFFPLTEEKLISLIDF